MKERKLIAKWVMAPDGTMLPSFFWHDYRTHKMEDGRITTVDGGRNPIYNTDTNWEATNMSVYLDDPFEVIRRFFCRLHKGADGKQKPTWTPLFKMSDKWLDEVIILNRKLGKQLDTDISILYEKERMYRFENSIHINE